MMPHAVAGRSRSHGSLKQILQVHPKHLARRERIRIGLRFAIRNQPFQKLGGLAAQRAHANGRYIQQMLIPNGGVRQPAPRNAFVNHFDVYGQFLPQQVDRDQCAATACAGNGYPQGVGIDERHKTAK